MGKITLKGIKVYAYHGCLQEETRIGSPYEVHISVWANLKKATQTDDLEDTVDYVHINHIVKKEMAVPSKLLEHVAQRILNTVFKEVATVKKARVRVVKINPPINGDVHGVAVQLKKKRRA